MPADRHSGEVPHHILLQCNAGVPITMYCMGAYYIVQQDNRGAYYNADPVSSQLPASLFLLSLISGKPCDADDIR